MKIMDKLNEGFIRVGIFLSEIFQQFQQEKQKAKNEKQKTKKNNYFNFNFMKVSSC
jgi:hypothetical protein